MEKLRCPNNNNTKLKKAWQMIRRITTKIATLLPNILFITIKAKAEKSQNQISKQNTESYNQPFSVTELKESLNKTHNTAVRPYKIHYQSLKELPKTPTQSTSYKCWIKHGIAETSLKYGNKP